ncbi:hypothetical protein [Streptomyces sp. CA-179760]|uniref:hypothetical protein n=1 Tax=Streptomyces sp. CA-179760 TaxID=3240054 RepID=UPI003D9113D0
MSWTDPPESAGFFAGHTVRGLAEQLRSGRASPQDLVDRALRDAARLDPHLGAFVTVDADGPGLRRTWPHGNWPEAQTVARCTGCPLPSRTT